MRRAYHADSALAAEAELCTLAAELDRTHSGAAASLREGMDETLTVLDNAGRWINREHTRTTITGSLRTRSSIERADRACRWSGVDG